LSKNDGDSDLADDDELKIHDVMIEFEDPSLTLAKADELKTPARSIIQVDEDSLINDTKKVDSIRLKLNDQTPNSRLNKEMEIDSMSKPQIKMVSIEKPKPDKLVPQKV